MPWRETRWQYQSHNIFDDTHCLWLCLLPEVSDTISRHWSYVFMYLSDIYLRKHFFFPLLEICLKVWSNSGFININLSRRPFKSVCSQRKSKCCWDALWASQTTDILTSWFFSLSSGTAFGEWKSMQDKWRWEGGCFLKTFYLVLGYSWLTILW